MLEHEPEKFPPSMWQGPKVEIPLRPPSSRHWNIDSDLTFTIAVDTHRQQHEAKGTGQDQERESVGAEESPKETPAPEGASLAIAGSSQAASPMETACQEEQDLEVTLSAIRHIHAIRLQTMHDMGCVREVEQAAVSTLWWSLPGYKLSWVKTSSRVYPLYAWNWRPPARLCWLTYSTS